MKTLIQAAMLGVALLMPIGFQAPAFAFDKTSPAPVNVEAGQVILKGFDAVAYVTQNQAVKGSAEFTAGHDGVTYHFASAANRDAFTADPARFVPAFGGFCAMGVALGVKYDIDPEAFTVVNGRLYMNLNKSVQKEWRQNIGGNIATAETKWPTIMATPPGDLYL